MSLEESGVGEPQESFKEVSEAYKVLVATMTHRATEAQEQWKEEHGFQGQSWDKILEDTSIDVVPTYVSFEEQWHSGQVIDGDEFLLEYYTPNSVFTEPEYSGEAAVEAFEKKPVEERTRFPYKTLHLQTRRSGVKERWSISFLPDSPPYAVNLADAKQAGYGLSYEDPAAARAIKAGFGEEAVPNLTLREMQTLTRAIQQTPAKISGAY